MSIALNFFKLVVLIHYVSLNMTLDRLKCFELGYSYWEDLMRPPCIIASIERNSVEPYRPSVNQLEESKVPKEDRINIDEGHVI